MVATRSAVRSAAVPVRPPRRAASASPTRLPGGVVDCSIGTPCDPVPDGRVAAAAAPRSTGRWATRRRSGPPALREAAAAVDRAAASASTLDRAHVVACVGTKEIVASLPHFLRLRNPQRDTVLYPAVAYPTLRDGRGARGLPGGAGAARRRLAPRPRRGQRRRRRARARALDERAGQPDVVGGRRRPTRAASRRGLGRAASWSRATSATRSSRREPRDDPRQRGSTACSRCTALEALEHGRACASASTPAIPISSRTSSRPASTPGSWCRRPIQAAAVAALGDDEHVDVQRSALRRSAATLAIDGLRARRARPRRRPDACSTCGCADDAGADDGWEIAARLARAPACSSRPATSTAPPGADHVRLALAQPHERLELALDRLARRRDLTPDEEHHGRPREDDHAALGAPATTRRGACRGAQAHDAVREAIDLLDRGEARVAEVVDDEVVVHEWVKQAILLWFRFTRCRSSRWGRSSTSTRSRSSTATRGRRAGRARRAARFGAYLAPTVVTDAELREHRRVRRRGHDGRHVGDRRLVRADRQAGPPLGWRRHRRRARAAAGGAGRRSRTTASSARAA